MRAFHINWTAPFFVRNKSISYYIDDFEILTTILSVLKWIEHNGSIKLYTDDIGAKYYKSIGIIELWNLGYDTEVLNNMPIKIDARTFWAGAKIVALSNEPSPTIMIDTDFIVWQKLYDNFYPNDIVVIHREDLYENTYPPKDKLRISNGYSFDKSWSWNEPACNTAFVYFGNSKLKEYYVDEALRFMDCNYNDTDDVITQMVFAEQRLLAMCAKNQNIQIKCFTDNPFSKDNTLFTHVWGLKDKIRKNQRMRDWFCKKCINRIIKDFPDKQEMLKNILPLNRYFN